jgi:TonB family protein
MLTRKDSSEYKNLYLSIYFASLLLFLSSNHSDMKFFKTILLIALCGLSNLSSAQKSTTPTTCKQAGRQDILKHFLSSWKQDLSPDSFLSIYVREFCTKEYDAAKANQLKLKLLKQKYSSAYLGLPDKDMNYCTGPILVKLTKFDSIGGYFIVNLKSDWINLFSGNIHDSKTSFKVSGAWDGEFPLKFAVDIEKGRKFVFQRTLKSKEGKPVFNANVYLSFEYDIAGGVIFPDNDLKCNIKKIELWDSKERKVLLGKTEKVEKPTPIDYIGTSHQIASEAGSEPDRLEDNNEMPYSITDISIQPEFRGSLDSFITHNKEYPAMEREAGIEGEVKVRFIVEKDGSLSDIAIKTSVSPGLDEEAIRLVKKISGIGMWKPATHNGKPVIIIYDLRIKFKL